MGSSGKRLGPRYGFVAVLTLLAAILATSFPSYSLAQSPPAGAPGLVAYYPFDGDARDYSGNGNHGTNSGAVFVAGKKGQALKFDGVDDYVSAPVNINPEVMPQMTMVAWVQADKVTGTVISHDNGGYDRTIDIDNRGGGTGWSVFTGSGAVLGYRPVTLGEWVFIAAVYDQNAKKVRLHVDAAVYEEAGTLGSGWNYINIGRNPSYGATLAGTIDEVRIYNYALSSSEIASLRAGAGPGPAPTPTPTPQATPTPPARQVDTTLIADERVVAQNGTVALPIRLEKASRLGSLNFSIRYDPMAVKVNRVDGGDLVGGALFQSNTREAGVIRFGIATQSAKGISGNGPVTYVVFTATGARGSASAMTLGDLQATDSSGGRVSLSLKNGKITIGTKVKGDYDGDGRLTARDALAALKMSVRELPADLNLDMDNDSRVSAEDARRILSSALSTGIPAPSEVTPLLRPTPTVAPTPPPKDQSERESELISNLVKASKTPAKVRMENGIARTVRATLPVPASAGDKPEDKARAILEEYRGLYGLGNVKAELAVTDVVRTNEGKEIVSFQRMAGNVPIFASSVVVHISPGNAVTYIGAGLPSRVDVAAEPRLSKEEAVLRARNAAQVGDAAQALDTGLVVFNEGIITGESTRSVLTWMVTLDISDPPGELVSFVDALSGEVVFSYDDLQDALDRRTYTALNQVDKVKIVAGSAPLWFTEGGQVPNVEASADGRKAHDYAGKIYEYFKNTFGRDSYDGKGARIRSFVHYHTKTNNAFWSRNLTSMFFMNDMVFLDVFAHEFTHAVTSSTAGLVYEGASGALNESFSDVFAAFIEDWAGESGAWEIGEDLKGGAIRSLKDPPSIERKDGRTFPTHMTLAPRYVKTNQDHGGVHINSSIPNYVAYLLVNGGEHPTSKIKVNGIGRAKAEQLYYKVLTEYLKPNSDFSSLSLGMIMACEELRENKKFGFGYRDCGRANNALAAVGLAEKDTDEDSWTDTLDNCENVYNPEQEDKDRDGVGDACEAFRGGILIERFNDQFPPRAFTVGGTVLKPDRKKVEEFLKGGRYDETFNLGMLKCTVQIRAFEGEGSYDPNSGAIKGRYSISYEYAGSNAALCRERRGELLRSTAIMTGREPAFGGGIVEFNGQIGAQGVGSAQLKFPDGSSGTYDVRGY